MPVIYSLLPRCQCYPPRRRLFYPLQNLDMMTTMPLTAAPSASVCRCPASRRHAPPLPVNEAPTWSSASPRLRRALERGYGRWKCPPIYHMQYVTMEEYIISAHHKGHHIANRPSKRHKKYSAVTVCVYGLLCSVYTNK